MSSSHNTMTNGYHNYRVVLLSGNLRLSGSTTWILGMQDALRKLGCPVIHVVVGERSEVDVPEDYAVEYTGKARRQPLLRIYRLLQLHKLLPSWYQRKCRHFIDRRLSEIMGRRGWQDRVDLVIKDFTSDTPDYFLKYKLVSVIHQMLSPDWKDPQLRGQAGSSFILAAVSRAVADDARRLSLDIRHILYNPLDESIVRERAATFSPQGNYLLFVGKLDRGKGVYELLEAYARTRLSVALWFVGSGKEQAGLERRVRELGLQQRVRLLGFQANPYPYIAQAQLLVLPSRSEAMGYVCMEAAVLGTPFLVSDYEAAGEFFEDRVMVAQAPAASFVDRLAQRLEYALEHPSGPGLRAGVLEKLRPRLVACSYLELI